MLHKRIIRAMVAVGARFPCRSLFKKLDILPVPCIYLHSLMMFVVSNPESFQTNFSVHGMEMRNKTPLHRPLANLAHFQKGVSYSGIKIFNSPPTNIL